VRIDAVGDRADAATAKLGDQAGELGRGGAAGIDLGELGEIEQRLRRGLAGVAVEGQHVGVLAQAPEALDERLVRHAVGGDLEDDALGAERQRVHREQELGRDVQERRRAAGRLAQAEVAQRAGRHARRRRVRAVLALAAIQQLVSGQTAVRIEDRLAGEEDLILRRGGRVQQGSMLGHRIKGRPPDRGPEPESTMVRRASAARETARREGGPLQGRRDTAMCVVCRTGGEAGER
jgi:hypothetical protein